MESNIDPTLFKGLVGSLMYLTTIIIDNMYVVSLISKFVEPPKGSDGQVGKIIPRYITRATRYGILYSSTSNDIQLDILTMILQVAWTIGRILQDMQHQGHPKKHLIVIISSAKTKYVATTTIVCQIVWLRRVLGKLQQEQREQLQFIITVA